MKLTPARRIRLIQMFLLVLLATYVTVAAVQAQSRQSKYVYIGQDAKLVYVPDAKGDVIPDFSNCGYAGGGVKLPNADDVPAKVTIVPGEGDATARIQQAIDHVSALPMGSRGFRGAVLIKKGKYAIAGSLMIRTSGVVLRGEGHLEDGTVLHATGTTRRVIIGVAGTGQPHELEGTRRTITDKYVPVGSHSFQVDDASGFKPGDQVIVYRPSTKEWIHAIGMDALPPRSDGGKVVQWQPGTIDIRWQRSVVAVEGNKVTIDAPITNALQSEYGGGAIYKYEFPGRIDNVGVEHLRGESEYKSPTDEEHAWDFIGIEAAQNIWVRKVQAHYFCRSAVIVHSGAKWVTILDCANMDPVSHLVGGRRYSFPLNGQLCLVLKCRTNGGRHDCTQESSVPGPNVFCHVHCDNANADCGPHERWATGTLYDNVNVSGPRAGLNARNRGSMGTGQGWAGSQIVFWNSFAAEMWCENPPTGQNWAIGCSAIASRGDGHWESHNVPVMPASLYRHQLYDRLGKQAVQNVWPE